MRVEMHKSLLDIDNINFLNWDCTHSDLKAENIGELKIEYAHKDNLNISKVEKIIGETSHSNLEIGEISKTTNLVTFKGKVQIEKINSNAESLNFNSEHTDYSFETKNNKYKFIINHFKSEINLNQNEGNINIEEISDKKVSGDVNNGSTLIKMSCHKGQVDINS